MSRAGVYRLIANIVLVVHFGIVLFVIGGLGWIVLSHRFGWRRANGIAFRVAHLACILVVVAESWLGITCPLTTLESYLRRMAGSSPYKTGFVEHWIRQLLFFNAPSWVFILAYTVFGLIVVCAWWLFPPQFRKTRNEARTCSGLSPSKQAKRAKSYSLR